MKEANGVNETKDCFLKYGQYGEDTLSLQVPMTSETLWLVFYAMNFKQLYYYFLHLM